MSPPAPSSLAAAPQERTFAASRFADDSKNLSSAEGDADVVQNSTALEAHVNVLVAKHSLISVKTHFQAFRLLLGGAGASFAVIS